MIARGASQAEVARRLAVTREAVRQWVDAWRTGGPAALAPRPRIRRPRVEFSRVVVAIDQARRRSNAPLTTGRVRQVIERGLGVKYCASSARAILHRLGFSYSRKQGWRRSGERQGPPGALETRRRAS
jgi:transposase